jgi:L-methionine (R)-S-oxide reductase
LQKRRGDRDCTTLAPSEDTLSRVNPILSPQSAPASSAAPDAPFERTAAEPSAQYRLLAEQLDALLAGETDRTANLANAGALLFEAIDRVNWVGFYLAQGDELVLGPFQGRPACTRIFIGSGVCGTAAQERTTLVVPDVHAFDGHIACDAASRSELVVPLVKDGALLGVLDVDSPELARFTARDRAGIELFASTLLRHL